MTDVVRKLGAEAKINEEEFNREAGVGILVSDDEINATVGKIFEESASLIKE